MSDENVVYIYERKKPTMILDSVEAGVSRLKSLLYAAETILCGSDYLDGEDLDSLKDIVDLCSECVRGVENKMSE